MNSSVHFSGDNDLLQLLKDGDEAAFTELYNRYWKRIYYLAASKLQNLSDAEELVQDLFAELWKRREELDIKCLPAYLSACTKFRVINVLEKRTHSHAYAQHTLRSANYLDLTTENALRLQELKDELFRQVSQLPEKCRLVFQLSKIQGFSHREISHQLSISEKTVESHLTKALKILRTGFSHVSVIIMILCKG